MDCYYLGLAEDCCSNCVPAAHRSPRSCCARWAFIAAAAAHLNAVPLPNETIRVMLEEGLEMFGYLMLLLSMTLFARYAVLESQGRSCAFAKRAAKPAKAAKPATATASATGSKSPDEAANRSVRPVNAQSSGNQAASAASGPLRQHMRLDKPQSQGPDPHRRLSKAERRALRKQDSHHDDDDE